MDFHDSESKEKGFCSNGILSAFGNGPAIGVNWEIGAIDISTIGCCTEGLFQVYVVERNTGLKSLN